MKYRFTWKLWFRRTIAIELCQIIHRTGLTQESIEALLLAVDVLKLVIDGAREQLHSNMQAKIKGKSDIIYSDKMV